jgi:hypothetical protein
VVSGSNLWSASPTLTVWVGERTELIGLVVLDIVTEGSALTAQSCRVEISKSTNVHDRVQGPFLIELAIISWGTFVLEVQTGMPCFYRPV